jgi:hypothetical protein
MILMGCIPTQSMTVIGLHAQMLMHLWFLCVCVSCLYKLSIIIQNEI